MTLLVTGILIFFATGIGVVIAQTTDNDWLGFGVATILFLGSTLIGIREIYRRNRGLL